MYLILIEINNDYILLLE